MQCRLFVSLVVAAMLAAGTAAAQSVSIEEQPDGIRLNVEDTPVEEVVDALARHYGFTFKILRPSDARLSGSRTGDALELLNWVLTGQNRAVFVTGRPGSEQVTRVVVYGPSGGAPPPQPRQPDEESIDPMAPDGPMVDDFPPEGGGSELEGTAPPPDAGIDGSGSDGSYEEPPQ